MKYYVIAFLGLCLLNTTASASLYRWVDDNGKVHYSDSLPPARVQKGHTQLDTLGNNLKTVKPAKSKEQIAKEKSQSKKDAKIATEKAIQARKDFQLLSSYEDVEQIDEFYADRIHLLAENRKFLELLRDKLDSEMARLRKQYETSPTDAIKKQVKQFINTNLENAEAYRNAIDQNRAEEQGVQAEALRLRERFLHLQEEKRQAEADAEKQAGESES